jgi:cytochrome c553
MRLLFRRVSIVVGCLLGFAVVGYAVIYALSERILRRTYDVPAVALKLPTDSDSIREGGRLATIRGCFGDCHGKEAEGRVLFDHPRIARIVAPNLTAAVRRYTDAQIAVIVRSGVRPDGRSMVVMPAEAFTGMTDADLGRIIAFLKSLPPAAGPDPDVSVGPLGRLGLVTGKFKTVAELVATTVPPPAATNPQAELGRYLAQTVCAECHGASLRGASNPDFTSPDLRVVASYSPEAFARLLRTGIALGDRTLGVMGERARNNLSHLMDSEIAALYSYLHAMPDAARN